jgi:hypothetical protein
MPSLSGPSNSLFGYYGFAMNYIVFVFTLISIIIMFPDSQELIVRFLARIFLRKRLFDDDFLKNREPEDVFAEFSYIEKIGYVMIPVTIFFVTIDAIGLYYPNVWKDFLTPFFVVLNADKWHQITLTLILFASPIAVFFIFFFSTSFRFYFAKILFINAHKNEKKFEKMKYYVRGLKEYNKFLAGNFGFCLDEMKMYSKFLSIDAIDEKSIISSFDYDNELKPNAHFMTLGNDFMTPRRDDDELLVQVKTSKKIKEGIVFVVTILPLVFLVLGLLFPSLRAILS